MPGALIRGTTLRRVVVLTAVGVLVAATVAWWALARGGDAGDSDALGTRRVQAGAVEVSMTALALDRSGAQFRLALDTHRVPLEVDLASTSQLRIDGRPAGGATWTGPGPGGHHREGTLRFATSVPAGATVELRVTGLPQDAVGTWTAR